MKVKFESLSSISFSDNSNYSEFGKKKRRGRGTRVMKERGDDGG